MKKRLYKHRPGNASFSVFVPICVLYLLRHILGASEDINLKLHTDLTFSKTQFGLEYVVSNLYHLKIAAIVVFFSNIKS